MYKVSEDYKNMLNKNVRTPKNKIVVDGVTYDGRLDLLTFPKTTQETTTMIGGFPAKTVEFELYNKDGLINLLNKDVAVYRGYDIGKLISIGDITRATNVTINGIDFSKGFSIKLRGFFDASKQATDYSRMFGSMNDTTLITLIDNPNILVPQIYTVGAAGGTREPKIDLSSFTKNDFLTITMTYDLANVTLTATNGEKTVTNSAARTGEPSIGSYFYVGSRDLTGNPIFEYDSVEINTYADNKNYKFIADETNKWKSVGDRATYTINGKWTISDNTEYIPMGIYRARTEEDITNNSTNKKIIFKGTDRAIEFNNIHDASKDPVYPCTYLEYLKRIVESYGYELESEDFPFANTVMSQAPNISNNTTDRELISRFAEMCGGIAQMSRTGKVKISIPFNTSTKIPKTYYSTLASKGKRYNCISTVILGRDSGNETVFDDVMKVDAEIQERHAGKNALSLLKARLSYENATINSVEDNKIILTSTNNAPAWENVVYDLDTLYLTPGTYTLYAKGNSTNNTSADKTWVNIEKFVERGTSRISYVALKPSASGSSVQFTIEDGFYYSIVFFASTQNALAGTNTVTYSNVYIAKEDTFSGYEPYEENGASVWRIDNNPFLDLIREEMIDAVAENIIGQSMTPFQLDECIDDFIYDLNDIVEVQDKMGAWFETRILSINSSGRIRTSYGAYAQEETTSYNLVRSTDDTGRTIKLDVDKVNARIDAINQTLDGYGTQFTQTDQNFQFLFNENSNLKDYINFENGSIVIGKVGNEYKLVQYNDRIIFLQNQQETAKLLYNLFFAEDIHAGKSLQINNYIWETDEDDGLDLDWGGE